MNTPDKISHIKALVLQKTHHIKRFISQLFTATSASLCKKTPTILLALSLPASLTHAAQLLDSNGHVWQTPVMHSAAEKARGLMYRLYLHPRQGMIFRFDPPEDTAFWMYHTYMPLALSFYDAYGRLLTHYPYVPPCYRDAAQCPVYPAHAPAAYVLETRPASATVRPPYALPEPAVRLVHLRR